MQILHCKEQEQELTVKYKANAFIISQPSTDNWPYII